jgi:phosphoribosylformylglycinamidine synthase
LVKYFLILPLVQHIYKNVHELTLGKINENNSLNIDDPPIIMCHNKSGRYESRFSTVKINPSNAIMFKDMEESILGVWIAHAEG